MTAFGNNGGMVNGSYSGTSTTYVPQTTMVPYSVDRYSQIAAYFKPLDRKGLGVKFDSLSDQQRQQIGTNKGLAITAVRKGSPAFMADVLPGDIILSVNGQPVFDAQSSFAAMLAARGGTADLVISRNGDQIKKSVSVPVGEW
jgi:S1-C subfamily serine protease